MAIAFVSGLDSLRKGIVSNGVMDCLVVISTWLQEISRYLRVMMKEANDCKHRMMRMTATDSSFVYGE